MRAGLLLSAALRLAALLWTLVALAFVAVNGDEDTADAGVEAVAQVDALGFGQRVLVQSLTGELQQRTVDLRRKSTAREQVGLVALFRASRVLEPPGRVLLADVERRLEPCRSPDFLRKWHVL